MSVEPGFSGQAFISSTSKKIKPLVTYRDENELTFRIGIDGGVNQTNIARLADKGVDDFAIASGIFHQNDVIKAIKDLKELTF